MRKNMQDSYSISSVYQRLGLLYAADALCGKVFAIGLDDVGNRNVSKHILPKRLSILIIFSLWNRIVRVIQSLGTNESLQKFESIWYIFVCFSLENLS